MRYIPCLIRRAHTIVPTGNPVRLSIYTPLILFGNLSRPYLLLITLCFYSISLSPIETLQLNLPLLVASSNNVVSTFLAAIFTYLTTDPRIKQFLTAI